MKDHLFFAFIGAELEIQDLVVYLAVNMKSAQVSQNCR